VALLAADVGIFAQRVAVPDIDQDAGERDARVAIDLRHDPAELERRPSTTLPVEVSTRM
jgi:hypothetical protein